MNFENILIVCIGNICRSPMSAGLFQQRLLSKNNQFPKMNIQSAGLSALVDHPADEFAVKICKNHHIDISQHRAQQLNSSLCQWADIILVMSAKQKKHIEHRFQFTRGKVHLLRSQPEITIEDPYGKDEAFFNQTFDEISIGVRDWIDRLRCSI